MFSPYSKLISEFTPLDDHISDDVVVMKNNGVFGMFAVGGVHVDTADDGVVASWLAELHNTYHNVGDEDIGLELYDCRGETDIDITTPSLQRDPFPAELDEQYRRTLARETLFSNGLYLGVLVRPPNVSSKLIEVFSATPPGTRAAIIARAKRLTEVCERIQAQLHSFGLRRLGYDSTRGHRIFDPIAEAIAFAMTGVRREIGVTTGRMGKAIFSEYLHMHWDHIQIDGAGAPQYVAMFTFRYPASTFPGMLHKLAAAPYRCTMHHSYRFISNAEAESLISKTKFKREVGRDKAISQTRELIDAADELVGGSGRLGDHSFVMAVFADNKRGLTESANAAWHRLNSCGLNAIRLKGGLLRAAWLSMMPGGDSWWPRRGKVKSKNFAAFAPLYCWPTGKLDGHWGEPIATFRTLAGTPYNFHWHVADVGNTLITGRTGSGKTTLTAFLIAMTAGRARIVGLDHKRGWQILAKRLGADYAVLGDGKPHFAPLKGLSATPANIEFLLGLWRGCIGGQMTQEEDRRLALGINTIMHLPPAQRKLNELRAFFDDNPEGAGRRLEKWIWGNELGWVLDAPKEILNFGDCSFFDTTKLLSNATARGPSLTYLFHRVSLLLTGQPAALFCDEGWRALEDVNFSEQIHDSMRTIRSKNGIVVFITQAPEDIIESGIARTLIEQCRTQIHMNNPLGTQADYMGAFGLRSGQYEAFKSMPTTPGTLLLKQDEEAVVLQLPLGGMPEFIPILSAPEANLRSEDAYVEEMREAAE